MRERKLYRLSVLRGMLGLVVRRVDCNALRDPAPHPLRVRRHGRVSTTKLCHL